MKKAFWTGLLLMVLLVSSTGSVFAGAAIELISVTHDSGGVKFTFRVNGEFSNANLKGSGHINGGDDFVMDCAQKDETTIVCFAPHKAGGQSVAVTFGGATFWTDVPDQQSTGAAGTSQYCYSAWADHTGTVVTASTTYDVNGNAVSQSAFISDVVFISFTDFGPICQDAPAKEHDAIVFDIPGGFQSYGFFDPDPTTCSPNYGSAYYTRFSVFC